MEDVTLANKVADKVLKMELPAEALIQQLNTLLENIKKTVEPVTVTESLDLYEYGFTDQFRDWLFVVDEKINDINDRILNPAGYKLNIQINTTYIEDWSFLEFLQETDSVDCVSMYEFNGPVMDYFYNTFYKKVLAHLEVPVLLLVAITAHHGRSGMNLKNITISTDS